MRQMYAFRLGLYSMWNFSLFHYRAQGEIGANVLVGIQGPEEDTHEFKNQAQELGYEFTCEMSNESYRLLIP
ncbi:unnamed protein product [Musa acuminata subsp. malaccensis]|uniref:(wild Malaysian banana) hypothetical protein n=1 Tax=Musa acuminata subsp. malaccensis TaxID=214687 RepID=A0A8D7A4L5_MUSAM|nr:unnamed protein product [Musa acuminata subsp. malaccensis]